MNKYRMLTKIVRNMKLNKSRSDLLLTDNEQEALRFIKKHENCTLNMIVNYLNVDKGLVSRIIKKLINLNYIIINIKEDKRKKHLEITKSGLLYLNKIKEYETNYYTKLFTDITQSEQETFFKTLEKIYLTSKKIRKCNNEKI